MSRQKTECVTLDQLPEPALGILIKHVRKFKDKRALMGTCKTLACSVLRSLSHQLELDSEAGWAGVRQVLLWGSVESICFVLYDFEEEAMPSVWDSEISPISALAMVLGQHEPIFVRSLQVNQFSGIKHLTIDWDDSPLRLPWLVPPVVAACCPNLASLSLDHPQLDPDLASNHSLPCTSVMRLSLTSWYDHATHTSQQLHDALPNINTLSLWESTNADGTRCKYDLLPHARVLLSAWQSSLCSLCVFHDSLDDQWMQQLVDLPNITKIEFFCVNITLHDWKQQAKHLRWKEFTLYGPDIDWLHLGWLPLNHLKRFTASMLMTVTFPEGLDLEEARKTAAALQGICSSSRHITWCFHDSLDAAVALQLFDSTSAALLPDSECEVDLRLNSAVCLQVAAAVSQKYPKLRNITATVSDGDLIGRAPDLIEKLGHHCRHLHLLYLKEEIEPVDEEHVSPVQEMLSIVGCAAELASKQQGEQQFRLCVDGYTANLVMQDTRLKQMFTELLPSVMPVNMPSQLGPRHSDDNGLHVTFGSEKLHYHDEPGTADTETSSVTTSDGAHDDEPDNADSDIDSVNTSDDDDSNDT